MGCEKHDAYHCKLPTKKIYDAGGIEPDCPLQDAPDGDDTLNNEIINNQHKLMITAEQRGCDKTNQEWIEKIEKKIKELKDDLADQIKDGFDIGDFKHPSIITVLRELLPGKDGKT